MVQTQQITCLKHRQYYAQKVKNAILYEITLKALELLLKPIINDTLVKIFKSYRSSTK